MFKFIFKHANHLNTKLYWIININVNHGMFNCMYNCISKMYHLHGFSHFSRLLIYTHQIMLMINIMTWSCSFRNSLRKTISVFGSPMVWYVFRVFHTNAWSFSWIASKISIFTLPVFTAITTRTVSNSISQLTPFTKALIRATK